MIPDPQTPAAELMCVRCNQALVPGKVTASYMGSRFPIELLCCPVCGLTFVPEGLATGKMLEVEQALEDK